MTNVRQEGGTAGPCIDEVGAGAPIFGVDAKHRYQTQATDLHASFHSVPPRYCNEKGPDSCTCRPRLVPEAEPRAPHEKSNKRNTKRSEAPQRLTGFTQKAMNASATKQKGPATSYGIDFLSSAPGSLWGPHLPGHTRQGPYPCTLRPPHACITRCRATHSGSANRMRTTYMHR